MTLLAPAWLQNGENYSANNDRLAVFNSIIENHGMVDPREMVVSPMTPASMTVRIGEGHAFVKAGLEGSGLYSVVNVGDATVTIPAANSTHDRWDLIVVTVKDSSITGSADEAVFEVISGVPGANPSVPNYGKNSTPLARVLVRRGTSTINAPDIQNDPVRQPATLKRSLGASVFPVTNDAQLSALVQQFQGRISRDKPLVIFRSDVPRGRELQYSYDGKTWVAVNGAAAQERVEMHGVGPALLGGSATNANGFLIQAGSTAHKTSGSGDARVILPKAFPNGLITVVATNGHHEVTGTLIFDMLPAHPAKGKSYKYETNAFVYRVHDNKGNVKKNFQHRINWIAVGW